MEQIQIKEFKVEAYHVAENIDIKNCSEKLSGTILMESKNELFYALSPEKYVLIFSYGVVVFYDTSELQLTEVLKLLFPVKDKNLLLKDDFKIIFSNSEELKVNFNSLSINRLDQEAVKIVMLNLAQSLAIAHYDQVSQELLFRVRQFTTQMEDKGTLKISRKNIMRFIGKGLNTKNKIAENLYILDAPPVTWNDEYLDEINRTLSKHFDLALRYRSIENTFNIIEANLDTFLELYHQKESSKLEWIIIILILVEVIDTFVTKLL